MNGEEIRVSNEFLRGWSGTDNRDDFISRPGSTLAYEPPVIRLASPTVMLTLDQKTAKSQ